MAGLITALILLPLAGALFVSVARPNAARGAAIHSGIDPAFIKPRGESAEHSANPTDGADEPIPKEAIHPARQERRHAAQRDDGVAIKFVDPHFVFEESEQSGLSLLKGIGDPGAAIHQNAEANSNRYQAERDKEHWLHVKRG